MGLASSTNDTASTPGRKTTITWDVAETVLVEPGWSYRRVGSQIAPVPKHTLGFSARVMRLSTGYWGLEPYAREIASVSERQDGGASVITGWQQGAQIQSKPMYRPPTDLPHATDGASPQLAVGAADSFLTVRRKAGDSWNLASLPAPPVLASRPLDVGETATTLEMDAGAIALEADPEDTGYLIRFVCPGQPFTAPDVILDFYFGGPLEEAGFGQFALRFRGSGLCELYEYARAAWNLRRSWRFAKEGQIANVGHAMRIIPHAGFTIEFQADTTSASLFSTAFDPRHGEGQNQAEAYVDSPLITGRRKEYPYMTGRGQARLSHRRDLRLTFQVARLFYPVVPIVGTIQDLATVPPYPLAAGGLVNLNARYWGSPGAIVTGAVRDARDGTLLPAAGVNYVLPGQGNGIFATFTLSTTDKYHSPWLEDYTISHAQRLQTITAGEFTGGAWDEVRVEGSGDDPSHEQAHVLIHDRGNELPKLAVRAELPVKIEVGLDPNHPETKSVIFRGYSGKITAKRRGFPGARTASPNWHDYDCSLIGMWQRLFEHRMLGQWDFAVDFNAPKDKNGTYQPAKVTDALRTLIARAGFPDDQIDVPDLPMRLFKPANDADEPWAPMPFTQTGEWVTKIAYDYLGGYLLWDANAGAGGMWRLRLGARAGTVLWNFTTAGPADPMRVAHRLASYPAKTAPIYPRDSMEGWVAKPDGNVAIVTTTGEILKNKASAGALIQWAVNFSSFNPPGGPGIATPNNPDWLGREVFIYRVDPLYTDQPSVDWACRRLYNLACRSFKMVSFAAPAVYVTDPADTFQQHPRLLRYGDTITVDSVQYLVKSVTLHYHKDDFQMMQVEAQQARADDL